MSADIKKIIVDTDPGIDDAIALCYAMMHPTLDLKALTTIFGNVDIQLATDNAARLCQLNRNSTPIAKGAAVPLTIAPHPHAYFVHGDNGLGNVSIPLNPYEPEKINAAEQIIAEITAQPGEITLVAVGPLTNLALALKQQPDITTNVKSVVIMGGAFDKPGNVTPWAEANIWNDPHAAQAVLTADWPVVILGLDVTHQVSFSSDFFDQLAAANPSAGSFLHDAAEYYIEFYEQKSNFNGCCPHDQLALAYVTHPEWFTCETTAVDVVTSGEQAGRTIRVDSDCDKSKKQVATKVDVDRLQQDYLTTLTAAAKTA